MFLENRMGRTVIKILFVWAIISSVSYGQIIFPPAGDIFEFDFQRIYRSGLINQDWNSILSTGPIQSEKLITIQGNDRSPLASAFETNLPGDMNIFTIISERYYAKKNQTGQDLPLISGGITYRPGKHFGAISHFVLDRAKAVDPDYTGKKYRGLAGNLETAAISYHKGKVSLLLGRTRLYWGPQLVNLIFSSRAEPFDLFSAQYQQGRLTFNFIFGRPDGSRPDSTDSLNYPNRSFNENRYIAGHRIDIRLHHRIRLGLFETVIYGGEGRSPELYYLNPLQFFHSAQLNEDENDNTILGGDIVLLLGKSSSLFGQLIVDDFQIDNKSQGDQEPNEIGYMVGFLKVGQTASFIPGIKAEYTRITNRTYHQREPQNRYLYRNKLIGHPLGSDADSISLSLRFWPNSQFFVELEGAYCRHGEGSIFNSWDEPWLDTDGEYTEPFPTGIIEKSTCLAIRAQGYLPFSKYAQNHLFVSMQAGIRDIRNFQNISGADEETAFFQIGLSWFGFISTNVNE